MAQLAQQAKDDRSLGELLSELTHELVTLVRQEFTLAKAELSQKASNIGKHAGVIAAGGALIYAGTLAIVAALVFLLALIMPLWVSALIVGVVVAAIGGLLVKKGLDAIRQQDMVPRQTLETLKEIQHGQ
jgi:hypothetical protein